MTIDRLVIDEVYYKSKPYIRFSEDTWYAYLESSDMYTRVQIPGLLIHLEELYTEETLSGH